MARPSPLLPPVIRTMPFLNSLKALPGDLSRPLYIGISNEECIYQ